jgi:serine phosphatase RsbU (regulator of sigma subunit)/tetratricopeptide (TPR) repeat protein
MSTQIRVLYIVLVMYAGTAFSQSKQIDSLCKVIKVLSKKPPEPIRDTSLIDAKYHYGELVGIFRVSYWDSLATEAKQYQNSSSGKVFPRFFLLARALSLNNAGVTSIVGGQASKAIEYYNQSLEVWIELEAKENIALTLKGMGRIYEGQGNIPMAMDQLHRSLKLYEELKDKKQTSVLLNDIGTIYDLQGDSAEALNYHHRSLKLKKELNDKEGIASSLTNIGSAYKNGGNYTMALDNFEKGLKIYRELDNKHGIAAALNNIGTALKEKKNWAKSLEYFREALKLMEEIKNKQGTAILSVNIAEALFEDGKVGEAESYALRSMKAAKELGYPDDIRYAALALKKIYKSQNKFKESLEMYELYLQMRDSLENEDNRKVMAKKYFQAEYERQADKDSIANVAKIMEQDFKHEQAITQQRAYTYGGIVGFVLMLVVAGVSFRAYRNKQKANIIITEQKQIAENQKLIIEEKQKEILDSIHYAQRIQHAILAKEEEICRYFPESFLLYKPKDIVAGDFYFFEHTNDHAFYAAADCTGHGVPGALVSVVCSNALSRCVKEFELTDPGKILDKARELVLETFRKSGQDVKDGMDISLMVKNVRTNEFKWAGANNPLWFLQDNEMQTIKANKQPIGLSENPMPFTTHSIPVRANDTIFLFTDGMADQFGGPKGKKFKYKQITEVLLSAASNALRIQKDILEKKFYDWKGELEQVDDVCVIGIKV